MVEDILLHVKLGNITVSEHPKFPEFKIYCYSRLQNFSDDWDEATLSARGLIIQDDKYIRARGFKKFFNYGQTSPYNTEYSSDDIVRVRDKLDGSLGILYFGPGGWAIATKGSFKSEQAVRGTKIFHEKYHHWVPPAGHHYTYLFEIIYPENRIVVDYGDMEDLIYIGHVNNNTGATYFTPGHWPGPSAEDFGEMTLKEALELGSRENKEGVILQFSDGRMLKVKQEDYVELHRIVTGLTPKRVFEHWSTGEIDLLLSNIPDEFSEEVRSLVSKLNDARSKLVGEAALLALTLEDQFDSRKELAGVLFKEFPDMAHAVLAAIDGKVDKLERWVQNVLSETVIKPMEGSFL